MNEPNLSANRKKKGRQLKAEQMASDLLINAGRDDDDYKDLAKIIIEEDVLLPDNWNYNDLLKAMNNPAVCNFIAERPDVSLERK